MDVQSGSDIIKEWPEESREAAQLVIDKYGEPHEVTDSFRRRGRLSRFRRRNRRVPKPLCRHHRILIPRIRPRTAESWVADVCPRASNS